MKKKRVSEYPLQIEIINEFMVVKCKEFGIILSAGRFKVSLEHLEMPHPYQIGMAVYKVLNKIQDKLNQDINENSSQSISQEEKKTLSNIQASKLLKVSGSTLRRMIDKGIIECEKTSGKQRRPLIESIYKYLGDKK